MAALRSRCRFASKRLKALAKQISSAPSKADSVATPAHFACTSKLEVEESRRPPAQSRECRRCYDGAHRDRARRLGEEERKTKAGGPIGWRQHDVTQRLADARSQDGNSQTIEWS